MKFVSKYTNYRLILKPGLPGNRQLGTPSTPPISVRFEGGMAEVREPELIELMLRNRNCGKIGDQTADFIPVEEQNTDPFYAKRVEVEPSHSISNIEFGHVGKQLNPKKPTNVSNEQMEVVKKLATEMAMEIINKMQNVKEKVVSEKKEVYDSPQKQSFTNPMTSAPEPIEDDGKILYEEVQIEKPEIERMEANIGGVEIGEEKIKEEYVEPVEPVTEKDIEPVKVRKGRPPMKK